MTSGTSGLSSPGFLWSQQVCTVGTLEITQVRRRVRAREMDGSVDDVTNPSPSYPPSPCRREVCTQGREDEDDWEEKNFGL